MKKNRSNLLQVSEWPWVRILLRPFTWLYGLLIGIRNVLYDKGIISSKAASQFSVVVGNLTVGGTGKTPMIEYLTKSLPQAELLLLSRGYGRRSRGFVLASAQTGPDTIGDEPAQYVARLGVHVPVAVCENRLAGSRELARLYPDRRILLLDDAYQHRALRPALSILLNDFTRPFYRDEPFPGGRLREPRRGARRADAIVTTKCPPDLSAHERESIRQQLRRYAAADTPCFFAGIRYGAARTPAGILATGAGVVLVAGIARPQPLVEYVARTFCPSFVALFPDHHRYTGSEVDKLLKKLKKDEVLLTTEKDMVKLQPLVAERGAAHRLAVLPMTMDFGADAAAFDEWLQQRVKPDMLRSVPAKPTV